MRPRDSGDANSNDALQPCEENLAADRPLAAATREALSRLDRIRLTGEGRDRLLHFVARNHREARGCDAAEQRIASDLFDQNVAKVCQALKVFSVAIVPSREDEAMTAMRKFMTDALSLLEAADFEGLGRKLTAFSYRRYALSQPVPPPSPEAEARRTHAAGWNGLEQEALAAQLKVGETLASFDAWRAITSTGRIIDRQELREKYRPDSWTRIDDWPAQFPPIPDEPK